MSIDIKIKKKLDDFLLDVEMSGNGEVSAILGESGCGKSMTLRCIAGVETPDEGHIVVNGKTYFDSAKKINLKPQERNVGMLFQNYALFPNMNVEQNIRCGLEKIKNAGEKRRLTEEAIRRFKLEGMEKKLPHQLSGGQQQRTALARMMVSDPEVILLDEPFSALDEFLRDKIMLETKELITNMGKDVLLVTHSMVEAHALAEQLIIMENGKLLKK